MPGAAWAGGVGLNVCVCVYVFPPLSLPSWHHFTLVIDGSWINSSVLVSDEMIRNLASVHCHLHSALGCLGSRMPI